MFRFRFKSLIITSTIIEWLYGLAVWQKGEDVDSWGKKEEECSAGEAVGVECEWLWVMKSFYMVAC